MKEFVLYFVKPDHYGIGCFALSYLQSDWQNAYGFKSFFCDRLILPGVLEACSNVAYHCDTNFITVFILAVICSIQ